MSPRRLHRATILSMVTASAAMRRIVRCSLGRRRLALLYWECHAHLRVPLRARPPVRGHAEDDRRPGPELHPLRGAGAARLSSRRGPLQGQGLLQHRLRDPAAQPRARALGQGRRGQDGVEVEGILVLLLVLGLQERLQEVRLEVLEVVVLEEGLGAAPPGPPSCAAPRGARTASPRGVSPGGARPSRSSLCEPHRVLPAFRAKAEAVRAWAYARAPRTAAAARSPR